MPVSEGRTPTSLPVPRDELHVTCSGCNQALTVGGYIDDLDTDAYLCLDCRPVSEGERPWPVPYGVIPY